MMHPSQTSTVNDLTEQYTNASAPAREQADALMFHVEQLATKLEEIQRAWYAPLMFFSVVRIERRIQALIAYRRHLLWMDAAIRTEATTWIQ